MTAWGFSVIFPLTAFQRTQNIDYVLRSKNVSRFQQRIVERLCVYMCERRPTTLLFSSSEKNLMKTEERSGEINSVKSCIWRYNRRMHVALQRGCSFIVMWRYMHGGYAALGLLLNFQLERLKMKQWGGAHCWRWNLKLSNVGNGNLTSSWGHAWECTVKKRFWMLYNECWILHLFHMRQLHATSRSP